MTSKLTREQLIEELKRRILVTENYPDLEAAQIDAIICKIALAAMDSEPVAWMHSNNDIGIPAITVSQKIGHYWMAEFENVQPLYRHAQPAPETEREPIAWLNDAYLARGVVDGEAGSEDAGPGYIPVYREASPAPVAMDDTKLRELFDSWFASDCSFDLSPEASEADNIAWRESYWYVWQRCRAAMLQAVPLTNEGDIALHNYRTALEGIGHIRRTLEETFGGLHGTHVEPDVLMDCKTICDAIYAAYSGNSPAIPDGSFSGLFSSARALLDALYEFGPDEIAISEHVTNLEDALRNAAAPTGIQIIPDGYVIVPKEPTAQMYDAGDRQMATKQVWNAMLAAAPQEVR
ncbi:hypothetical protein SB6422_02796 [Klebsiella huaxiensis]|uniref:Eaa protein n=1 Tax=Klebsiella huaxiensis TaxID=2153354 RepID=A0A564M604_9ENTR|nr:hypothetical protein SB6422_02796 [Klebsiella huaxiensis]